MGFSTKIKSILSEREVSPSELARMTGYSPQYIHELLKGEKRWNEDSMGKVCDALKLEVTISTRA